MNSQDGHHFHHPKPSIHTLSIHTLSMLRHLTTLTTLTRAGVIPKARATTLAMLAPNTRRSLVVSASSEGQIQSELIESMRSKIQTALDAESVSVTDVAGDGRHVEIGAYRCRQFRPGVVVGPGPLLPMPTH